MIFNKYPAQKKNVNINLVANLESLSRRETLGSIIINKVCLNRGMFGTGDKHHHTGIIIVSECKCVWIGDILCEWIYRFHWFSICIEPSNGMHVVFFHSFSASEKKMCFALVSTRRVEYSWIMIGDGTMAELDWIYIWTKNQHSISFMFSVFFFLHSSEKQFNFT